MGVFAFLFLADTARIELEPVRRILEDSIGIGPIAQREGATVVDLGSAATLELAADRRRALLEVMERRIDDVARDLDLVALTLEGLLMALALQWRCPVAGGLDIAEQALADAIATGTAAAGLTFAANAPELQRALVAAGAADNKAWVVDIVPAHLAHLPRWSFGDGPAMADDLGRLVVEGRKTATCSLYDSYAERGEAVPLAGERDVVLDGRRRPLCIIETVEVTIRRAGDVDAEFAFEEGEGDRTLASWRKAHEEFFAHAGVQLTDDTKLVCERFKVVHRFDPTAGIR